MTPLRDITVLIAEDERPLRMLLRVVLEAAGATVIDADDGVRALRLLELHPDVDVLCTDLTMPNLDGIELIGASRTHRADLGVVVCSARELDTHELHRALPDAVVSKPFIPADLVRAIADAHSIRTAKHAALAVS